MDPRLRSAFVVYAFGVVGAFLVFAPWSSLYRQVLVWAEVTPPLGDVVASGWFRGAVSGLGLVDLGVAVREALRLRSEADGSGPGERG